MEAIIITIFILTAVFGIEIQYIVNKLAEPANLVYLGTVHWPADYFYYLSQFIQGKNNWIWSTVLFTPEKLKPVLVGWQNVLTGKILTGLGLNVILAYQVAVGIYLALFLFISYRVIREIFPEHKKKRLLAFFFFITATSLWRVLKSSGGWELSYFTHWYNLGNSLARFGPTPHHLIAYSLGSFILLNCILWVKNGFKNSKYLFYLLIAGFLQASINPVAWGLTALSIITAGAVNLIRDKRIINLLPGLILMAAGIFPSIYVKAVFSRAPYNISSMWESAQQLGLTPLSLIQYSGLIIIFGLLGIISFLRKIIFGRMLIFIFLIYSLFFYMSGISGILKISNARFWPSQVYIGWAVIASEGVFLIVSKTRKAKKLIFAGVLGIYLVSIIPTYYVSYKTILIPMRAYGFYYMPKDIYQAVKVSGKISKENDVFLVIWPYNLAFPALTGRKILFGDEFLTINYQTYMRDGFDIIDGKLTEDNLKRTLNKYRIKYLLMYTNNNYFRQFPFLKDVYRNPTVTLYRADIY